MVATGSFADERRSDWSDVRDRLRARGLRWTPQRRTLSDVLADTIRLGDAAYVPDRGRELCRALEARHGAADVVHDGVFLEGMEAAGVSRRLKKEADCGDGTGSCPP